MSTPGAGPAQESTDRTGARWHARRRALTAARTPPKPVREHRFLVNLFAAHLPAFREALVDLAGGFTEIATDYGTRYVVGLRGRAAKKRMARLLATWAPQTQAGNIRIESPVNAPDRDEIFFLLPLQRNPGRGPRQPLFTNEKLAGLRAELARRFHFRPVMVQVYGEWRNDAGELVPNHSLLVRVPRRGRGTVPALRRFLKKDLLGDPRCAQEYIYLSSRSRGEFVGRF